MAAYRTLRFLPAVIIIFSVACGKEPVSTLHPWAARPQPYLPVASSPNAFDGYVLAANQLQGVGGAYLTRVSFFPAQRNGAIQAASQPFKLVLEAATKPCEFRFVAHEPFQPAPYDQVWGLLGHIFAWRVADACKVGDYATAIDLAEKGSRFGFDLSGGGAMDAALGCQIVDEIRRALAPNLNQMGAGQLQTLSRAMRAALNRRIPLAKTIENEHLNMLEAVQSVQDAFLSGRLPDFVKQLGPNAKDAGEYLQSLREKDSKSLAYFEAFAREASDDVDTVTRRAALPAKSRSTVPDPPRLKDRPWKRFSQHFFGTAAPLLGIEDATVARTRLLILTAAILAQHKATGFFPSSLSGFSADRKADPFSGSSLIYHSDGAEFNLYSVGRDFKDDGGDTDDSFSRPDLKLEMP